ncbi:MAG: hypothetical protein HQM13_08140 [SAR324 cluster bacterium]|nr:hypothetical protein [SAR324 cluster bacterium]
MKPVSTASTEFFKLIFLREAKTLRTSRNGKFFSTLRLMFLVLLFACGMLPRFVSANNPVMLEGNDKIYFLGPYLDILEDSQKKWSIEEIASAGFAKEFSSNSLKTPNFGLSKSVFWVRFRLKNKGNAGTKWMLEQNYPLTDSITLYLPDGTGKFVVRKTGDLLPFREREVNYRNFVFPLLIEDEQMLYLRFETQSAMKIDLTLWSPSAFAEKTEKEGIILSLYYGFLGAMVLYNLLLFIVTREKNYAYYVIFFVLFAACQSNLNGLAFQLLWPDYPWWGNISMPFLIGAVIVSGLIFVQSYIESHRHVPRFHQMLTLLCVLGGILMPLSFFVNYSVSIILALLVSVVGALMAWLVTLRVALIGFHYARYLLIGFSLLVVSIVFVVFKSIGIIPDLAIMDYSLHAGTIFHSLFLSIALADKINQVYQENEQFAARLKENNETLQREVLERQKANQLLKEYEANLINLVEERTKELSDANENLLESNEKLKTTQAQLIQSAKLASIGELAAGIAHELNQPLTYIRNNTQLVMMDGVNHLDPQEVFETLKKVEDGSERMMNIIDHLRSFAREVDFKRLPIDLHDTLEASLVLLNEQLKLRNIEIRKNYAPRFIEVLGNSQQLQQVFINIMANARDALEGRQDGLISIETRLIEEKNEPEKVQVLIKDNGKGIPSANLDKIFDPFFSTKEEGKGTGLGMSISYGIVQEHHGVIRVSSIEGEGTSFEIIFLTVAHQRASIKEW